MKQKISAMIGEAKQLLCAANSLPGTTVARTRLRAFLRDTNLKTPTLQYVSKTTKKLKMIRDNLGALTTPPAPVVAKQASATEEINNLEVKIERAPTDALRDGVEVMQNFTDWLDAYDKEREEEFARRARKKQRAMAAHEANVKLEKSLYHLTALRLMCGVSPSLPVGVRTSSMECLGNDACMCDLCVNKI